MLLLTSLRCVYWGLYYSHIPYIFIACLQYDCLDTQIALQIFQIHIRIKPFQVCFEQQINTNNGLSMTDRVAKPRWQHLVYRWCTYMSFFNICWYVLSLNISLNNIHLPTICTNTCCCIFETLRNCYIIYMYI